MIEADALDFPADRLTTPLQIAEHQSLPPFVAKSDGSDQALLAAIQRQLLPAIECHGQIVSIGIES